MGMTMNASRKYQADLVSALYKVDADGLQAVIDCLKEARSENRRILVCGHDHGGLAGAQFLVDTLKQAKPVKGRRLRVLNLNLQAASATSTELSDNHRQRPMLEELKTFAE